MNHKPSILIVDDDTFLLATLKQIFESLNCNVKTAPDGDQALKMIETEKFSVILTDVRMPHMDGVSLLDAIEKRGHDIPVIVMTGYSDYTSEEIDAHNGVVLLEKPFSKRQIKEIVDQFIFTLPAVGE